MAVLLAGEQVLFTFVTPPTVTLILMPHTQFYYALSDRKNISDAFRGVSYCTFGRSMKHIFTLRGLCVTTKNRLRSFSFKTISQVLCFPLLLSYTCSKGGGGGGEALKTVRRRRT